MSELVICSEAGSCSVEDCSARQPHTRVGLCGKRICNVRQIKVECVPVEEKERCEVCRFWVPPLLVTTGDGKGSTVERSKCCRFPAGVYLSNGDWWCGEFKRKEGARV